MTIETLCIVQSGQISESQQAVLASRLSSITEAEFGQQAGTSWLVIDPGNGWTAGEPSTTSLVSMNVPAMDAENRTRLLHAICDAWSEETQCSMNEIVATAISAPEGE